MNTFWQFAWVAGGGAIGAIARFGLVQLFEWSKTDQSHGPSGIPIATLIANLAGCFMIGLLLGSGLGDKYPAAKYGVGIGFLGALTTFSTFSAESVQQIQTGQSLTAGIYIVLSLSLGVALVFAGIAVGKRWA